MRAVLVAIACAALLITGLPASSSPTARPADSISLAGAGSFVGAGAPADLTVPLGRADPTDRLKAWLPQDPGTKKWITLEYGPYVVHPGSDLSRMDVEIPGADGYAVGFEPSVVGADGKPISSHHIHIHHAHWYWLDPETPGYHRWFYGTGEERTQGSIWPAAKAQRGSDVRYGVEVHRGDRLGFLSMLHNKTAEALTVFLRVRIEYVYGLQDEIKKAKGWDFHALQPVLIGSTFNVPRSNGDFVYPLDIGAKEKFTHTNYSNPVANAKVVPGVGQVWTSPWSGTIVVGAGHSHPGAREVVLSNMGSEQSPCPEDGDRFPGVTAARSRNITRGGVFPSAEFQMGLTQPGWRMHVRKGDRIVLNGVYDSERYAYPDAMSFFGFYMDRQNEPAVAEACTVELVDRPNASQSEVTRTVPNQKWPQHHPMPTCKRCDRPGPLPKPGPRTNIVHIAGHQYLPGNLGNEGEPFGPPVVDKGDALTFINEDYAEGGVRHSVTSCKAPCNGPYTVNYPFHDGNFHSGALGYTYEETYVTAKDQPRWELDTSKLDEGYYTYHCQLHAWMRGGFYVK
ncbi:MAG: cupredoxin domain-containing protein [Actinomycetota bacterium]